MKSYLNLLSTVIYRATLCAILLTAGSCASTSGYLNVSAVTYQAVDTRKSQQELKTPAADAKIFATYAIDKNGKLAAVITNLTDSIMTIDQEKSFFVNTTGESLPYYDPNSYSETKGLHKFYTNGSGITIGFLEDTFGAGPFADKTYWEKTWSNYETYGKSTFNTITISYQQQLNIAPHASSALPKTFPITGVGCRNMTNQNTLSTLSFDNSPLKFTVYISYSLDGGKNYDKLISDFYVSSNIYSAVVKPGKINAALRSVMQTKPDMFVQPWYLVSFENNIQEDPEEDFYFGNGSDSKKVYDHMVHGLLYDYK